MKRTVLGEYEFGANQGEQLSLEAAWGKCSNQILRVVAPKKYAGALVRHLSWVYYIVWRRIDFPIPGVPPRPRYIIHEEDDIKEWEVETYDGSDLNYSD